jgi:threonine aldolase
LTAPVASFFDTSSLPTEAMLAAMHRAPLGDDVYGTDPTVNRLQDMAAGALGLEAALFVPSGTMANLIAIMVHTRRGDAVVIEAGSHIAIAETGGLAAVAGCMPIPVAAPLGILTAELLEGVLLPEDQHRPRPALVCIENTHNRGGGTVTEPHVMAGIAALCRERGLRLHVDGARVFNAAVALRAPVADVVAGADSVTFALSKGLSCPAGSLLAGSAAFIAEARRVRKLLGGAMRQAGVLAAAGVLALESGQPLLADDHRRARALAEGLAALPGVSVDLDRVQTNIVFCRLSGALGAGAVARELGRRGIECAPRPPDTLRFVTHRGIGDAEVDRAVAAMARLAAG